jgi:hypothetical protein
MTVSKYWKKAGLVLLGLFLTIEPYLFMLYVGILFGHYVTSRFNYKMSIKVRDSKPQKLKLIDESNAESGETADAEAEIEKSRRVKKTAASTKVFEHSDKEEA